MSDFIYVEISNCCVQKRFVDTYFVFNINIFLFLSDSFGSFVSYTIHTVTNIPSFSSTEYSVSRRYSDFLWLHTQLVSGFPGLLIPSIPEKQVVGRFDSEFIKRRKYGLNRFLSGLLAKKDVLQSKLFSVFLELDDKLFVTMRDSITKGDDKKNVQNTIGMINWIDIKLSSYFTSEQVAERFPKEQPDHKFDEWRVYLSNLGVYLQRCTDELDAYFRNKSQVNQSMFDFGSSLTLLGALRPRECVLAVDVVKEFSGACNEIYMTVNSMSETALLLSERLSYLLLNVRSAQAAIDNRERVKQTFIEASLNTETAKNSYQKLIGVSGQEGRAVKKLEVWEQYEQVEDVLKTDYINVSLSLLSELESFKVEKNDELVGTVQDLVRFQVEQTGCSLRAWEKALPAVMERGQTYFKGKDREEREVAVANTFIASSAGERVSVSTGDSAKQSHALSESSLPLGADRARSRPPPEEDLDFEEFINTPISDSRTPGQYGSGNSNSEMRNPLVGDESDDDGVIVGV